MFFKYLILIVFMVGTAWSQNRPIDTISVEFKDSLRTKVFIQTDKPYMSPQVYIGAGFFLDMYSRGIGTGAEFEALARIGQLGNLNFKQQFWGWNGEKNKPNELTEAFVGITLFDELSSAPYTLYVGSQNGPNEKPNAHGFSTPRLIQYEAFERSQMNLQLGWINHQRIYEFERYCDKAYDECSSVNGRFQALSLGLDYIANVNLGWSSSIGYSSEYKQLSRTQFQVLYVLSSDVDKVITKRYLFSDSVQVTENQPLHTSFGLRYISEDLKKNKDSPFWSGTQYLVGFMPTLEEDLPMKSFLLGFEFRYNYILRFGI